MGDFNTKLRNGTAGEFVGPYGPFLRNEKDEMWHTFPTEERIVVFNTLLKPLAGRLYA